VFIGFGLHAIASGAPSLAGRVWRD